MLNSCVIIVKSIEIILKVPNQRTIRDKENSAADDEEEVEQAGPGAPGKPLDG